MNIKNLFIIFLIQHTGLVSAGQPDIDYEEIKKHLLETYTRPHVHQYKEYDYVVTSNNFLTDEKFMTLTRQAYKNDPKAQKTLSELRDEYQRSLHKASKQADDTLKQVLGYTSARICYGLLGGAAATGVWIALIAQDNRTTILSLLFSFGASTIIAFPEDKDSYEKKIHSLDARIAINKLNSFIKNIEKVQKKCLIIKKI